MKIFLWTVLLTLGISAGFAAKKELIVVKDPAAARDLRSFYRSIQALSADSLLNGTAIAVV
ncbi:MAG: hypothetical protein DME57_05060 [Verrucomicrobia bacterium]|nr:MAG: hypothetical protein DME57_05060 [Verrucomicrobiota bacterium]